MKKKNQHSDSKCLNTLKMTFKANCIEISTTTLFYIPKTVELSYSHHCTSGTHISKQACHNIKPSLKRDCRKGLEDLHHQGDETKYDRVLHTG